MAATLANQITSRDEARALITELRNEFQQSLAALQTENQLLRQKLELFLKRYFGGTKNESLDPKQLELLLAGLTAVSALTPVVEKKTPARAATAARPGRQPLPAHLETERVGLEPAEVQQQPTGWRKLGEEVTEELDWKPAKFIQRLFSGPRMRTPTASSSRHCPPGWLQRDCQAPGCSPRCSSGNMKIICRSTGRRRFTASVTA